MATWSNQKTVTYQSGDTALTGGTCYWSKVFINGVCVMIMPHGIGSYMIDSNNGTAAPVLAAQLGHTFYTRSDNTADQTMTKAYWNGSTWTTRSTSSQVTQVIYCTNPSTW